MDYENDAEIQLAAALQGIPLEQAALQQKMRRAQGFMGTPTPQGAQIGRVYRAASPLEHLATALSRGLGARDVRQAEQDMGSMAQRANQAGLAATRIERADKDREFGLRQGAEQRLAANQASAAELANQQAMAREADAARDARFQQDTLRETRRNREQDSYSAIADPVAGGVVIFNKKTGQRIGTLPATPAPAPAPGAAEMPGLRSTHSRPGASAAQGAGGLKEAQRTAAARAGEGSIGMEGAIDAGFPSNKGLGGITEGIGWRVAESVPALVSEDTEQRKSFWENAADPIVRARTGAAMPVEEFRKQMTMLLPRPGEAPDTHIKKAAQMIALFKNQTVGLPPQVQGPLLEQLDALDARIPKTVDDYQRMKSSGKGGGGEAPQRAQGKDGNWYVLRGGAWEAE